MTVRKLNPKDNLETTSFGELAIAELTPTIQIQFPYTINTELLVDYSTTGTASIDSNMLKLSTGAQTDAVAEINTKDSIQYHPGQGTLNRFTALYTTGVSGSEQLIGIGNSSDGFFFGYNGADFGVLRRSGGSVEFQELEITTASSTAENVTVTLNGNVASVPVTASADIYITAQEIGAFDYSTTGSGWDAHTDGDGVVNFQSYDSSVKGGVFSLVATTAVGAFTRTLAGATPTDTWITQAETSPGANDGWDRDKADGSNILPLIDFTKGNVFEIRYQWLGFGAVYFYIEHPETGEYVNVHTIEYANTAIVPSVANPTLPLCATVKNTTNDTDIILRSGSISAFVEGKVMNTHFHSGVSATYTGIDTTETPVLTIHNKEVFQGKQNRINTKLILASFSADSSGNKSSIIRVRRDSILSGANYNDVNTSSSVIEFDIAATTITNGKDQFSVGMGSIATEIIDLDGKSYFLSPTEKFTITVQAVAGTVDGVVSVNWEELH